MGKKNDLGRKDLKILDASYGEGDLYNSGKFKPLTPNLSTGAMLGKHHHCDICTKNMTIACFEEFHYAFCAEWVLRKGQRGRCGERLCVHSDGCKRHPRVLGCNEPFYRAADGEHVELSEFHVPDLQNLKGESEVDDDTFEEEVAAVNALAEEHIEKSGFFPPGFYNDYWTQ